MDLVGLLDEHARAPFGTDYRPGDHASDPQNVTLAILELFARLVTKGQRQHQPPHHQQRESSSELVIDSVDEIDILAHNLTELFMKHYGGNNADLWSAVLANLEKEEYRWKEAANRRLSHLASAVLVVVYVSLLYTF